MVHRKTIRASKGVNELLYSNRESLQAVYSHFRECQGFTLNSACRLFNNAAMSALENLSAPLDRPLEALSDSSPENAKTMKGDILSNLQNMLKLQPPLTRSTTGDPR